MMKPYLLIVLLFFNDEVSAKSIYLSDYDIDSVAARFGLTVLSYPCVTNDSYVLQLHRVRKPGMNNIGQHYPVLLMHGMTGSSSDFLVTGKSSLAYMLLKDGYDVWLGNTRSSPYSTSPLHRLYNFTNSIALSRNSWDFSWHEMGMYDLPVLIDKILEETERNKTFYVGYSQGSTEFFVLTSLFPEYNDKIELMVGLAPAVFTGYIQSGPRLASLLFTYPLMLLTQYFGHFNLLFTNTLVRLLTSMFCTNRSFIIQTFCVGIPFILVSLKGRPEDVFLGRYLMYSQSKGSSKQFLHYSQAVYRPDEFNFYDYGRKTNELLYNSPDPPSYPLERIDAPVYVFHSDRDLMVPQKSVELLKSNIQHCVGTHQIENFNHLDFVFGKNHAKLYHLVLKVLKEFRHAANPTDQIVIKNRKRRLKLFQ